MGNNDDNTRPGEGVRLLDCSLRDGGYYNHWNFPHNVAQRYLESMSEAGLRYVEIGFRSTSSIGFKGAFAFSQDYFIDSLDIPDSISLGVMLNTSELVEAEIGSAVIDGLFAPAAESQVSFVRLASRVSEIGSAENAASRLVALGYKVFLNLMQFTEYESKELSAAVSRVNPELFDTLYLADSLGKSLPQEVATYFSVIQESWEGPLGFHGHDNRGLALANSHAAVMGGATWIDGTVTGIGRGAGNTRIDLLLADFADSSADQPRMDSLNQISEQYFIPLQRKNSWGPNYHYARAATKGIHPTFVQELLENSAYSSLEISAAIDQLGESDSARFEPQRLESIDSWLNQANSPMSAWNQAELFEGKTVLFIGGGATAAEHAVALDEIAKSTDFIVLVANLGTGFPQSRIDSHIACNPLRLIADSQKHARHPSNLIAPKELIPLDHREKLEQNGKLLDIGLTIEEGKYRAEKGIVVLPKPNVLAFGLLVAISGGAESIYLAGFDGFAEGDSRRLAEQEMIEEILNLPSPCDVKAITPTSLNLPQCSIYAL